jgi:DUF1365 family protein
MNSCFYEGTVVHHRLAPVEHRFRYRLFMTYVDLAELDVLFGRRGLWSTRGPAPMRFRREDFLCARSGASSGSGSGSDFGSGSSSDSRSSAKGRGSPAPPLERAVGDLVEAETGRRPSGPIRLLTNFRVLGFGMNPVSFYYCFDGADTRVETLVAEVTNTPWRERHCYVSSCDEGGAGERGGELGRDLEGGSLGDCGAGRPVVAKAMHVSPFMPMEMRYRWRIESPGERLELGIENLEGSGRPFQAALSLERRPMSAWQRLRLPLRYPLVPQRVALAIHWQAARLWWKGVPVVAHPKYGATQPKRVVADAKSAPVAEAAALGDAALGDAAIGEAAMTDREADYQEEKARV